MSASYRHSEFRRIGEVKLSVEPSLPSRHLQSVAKTAETEDNSAESKWPELGSSGLPNPDHRRDHCLFPNSVARGRCHWTHLAFVDEPALREGVLPPQQSPLDASIDEPSSQKACLPFFPRKSSRKPLPNCQRDALGGSYHDDIDGIFS